MDLINPFKSFKLSLIVPKHFSLGVVVQMESTLRYSFTYILCAKDNRSLVLKILKNFGILHEVDKAASNFSSTSALSFFPPFPKFFRFFAITFSAQF